MSEETSADCIGQCQRPGNRGGYWPTMVGNYVVIHERDCDGTVQNG